MLADVGGTFGYEAIGQAPCRRDRSAPAGDPSMTNEATARPFRAPEAIAQALTLHQRGRLEEAGRIYDAVLATDQNNFDALHLVGVLQAPAGPSIEGLRLVAAALKAQPGAADALINYGVILDALKRHQEALAAFDEALGEPRRKRFGSLQPRSNIGQPRTPRRSVGKLREGARARAWTHRCTAQSRQCIGCAGPSPRGA